MYLQNIFTFQNLKQDSLAIWGNTVFYTSHRMSQSCDEEPRLFLLYITGWGRLWWRGPLPDKLQEVRLPLVPQSQCAKLYDNFEEETMVCAGNVTHGGIDTCHVNIQVASYIIPSNVFLQWKLQIVT